MSVHPQFKDGILRIADCGGKLLDDSILLYSALENLGDGLLLQYTPLTRGGGRNSKFSRSSLIEDPTQFIRWYG